LLNKAKNQVEDLICLIDEWNKIVESKINDLSMTEEVKKWFKKSLLPKTYWKNSLSKTKYKLTKERIKEELLLCKKSKIKRPLILNKEEHEYLRKEAKMLCRKFQ
jgi:hypothetical protein